MIRRRHLTNSTVDRSANHHQRHYYTITFNITYYTITSVRPVASLPIMGGGRFPQIILDLFQGLKIGVPSGCLGETSIFKIIMTDDVTLWSKLASR